MCRLEPVTAVAEFFPGGVVRPLSIGWQGERLPVQQIRSIGSALSCQEGHPGLPGVKYRCVVADQAAVLYLVEGRWLLQVMTPDP